MAVKRLVVHGCSFAYGEELENIANQSWAALVAKSLNLELLNLAKPGFSNDGAIEELIAESLDPNNDLVIMMWTWNHRINIVDEEGWFTCFPENSDGGIRNMISNTIMGIADQNWLFRRWLTQVILLQEYFKSKGIKYLFVNAFYDVDNTPKEHPLFDQIDTKYFLGWPHVSFSSLAQENYGLLPLGHPNAEAHAALADIMATKIKEIYALI